MTIYRFAHLWNHNSHIHRKCLILEPVVACTISEKVLLSYIPFSLAWNTPSYSRRRIDSTLEALRRHSTLRVVEVADTQDRSHSHDRWADFGPSQSRSGGEIFVVVQIYLCTRPSFCVLYDTLPSVNRLKVIAHSSSSRIGVSFNDSTRQYIR